MKVSKKIVIHSVLFLILIIYLCSSNYIFNVLIKTEKEASLSKISVPAETQNIKCNIEDIKIKTIKWKDVVFMSGWVFRNDVKEEKREVYLVLKSTTNTCVFKIVNGNISRPDIIKTFQMDGNVWNHGFSIYFPLYLLTENSYQVGFVIIDETGKYYSLTRMELKLLNGDVSITGYGSGIENEYIFHQKSLNIQKSTREISFNFDKIDKTDKYMTIFGWSFLKGMAATEFESYILLKKGGTVHVFSVKRETRKDVTVQFAKIGLNLDSSGFKAQIPTESLEKGSYQLGLYMVKGDQTGIVYSDKYVRLGQ